MKRALGIAIALLLPATAAAKEIEVKIRFTGWKCGFCSAKVEKSVREVEGVRKAKVDKDRMTVVFDDEVAKTSDLIEAIERCGMFTARVEDGSEG